MPAPQRSTLQWSPETVPPERFVGRERELSELGAGLDEVLSGQGRLFFFVGEPGIGKTLLADEVASEAIPGVRHPAGIRRPSGPASYERPRESSGRQSGRIQSTGSEGW